MRVAPARSAQRAQAALLAASSAILACAPPAPPVPSIDAAGRDGGGGGDDAGADAGRPLRCDEASLPPWEVARGTWAPDFAPRGLSRDGAGRAVVAALAWRDGSIFVAGELTHAGPIPAANVAAWSEAEGWRALGAGVAEPLVAIAVAADGTVYAASPRTPDGSPGSIRRFAAGAWSVIGRATDVRALAIDRDGSLLAGGAFDAIDAVAAPDHLARWDGAAWTALTQPGGTISAIVAEERGLCVAGREGPTGAFAACTAPGAPAWTVMRIPDPPGPLFPEPVRALARDAGGRVIAGGALYLGAREDHGGVIRWSGTAWEPLGAGLGRATSPLEVLALAHAEDGALWAAGSFDAIGDPAGPTTAALAIARFTSERWEAAGALRGGARALAAGGGHVYAAGTIEEAHDAGGGVHAVAAIARTDGAAWSALAHPRTVARGPGDVRVIAARASCRPYVVGGFEAIEDEAISHVALVRGDLALGAVTTASALRTTPDAFAVGLDGTLYAGGAGLAIVDARGTTFSAPLARLVGTEWQPLGTLDPTGIVRALAVAPDGTLYVGGTFDDADPTRRHLLRWDGARLAAVGVRPEPLPITALLVHDGALYAAESLAPGARVSRFDGTSWTVLGDPLEGEIVALAAHDGGIVAGGLALLGGAPIARWDGGAWAGLGVIGSGTIQISALAVLGSELVAGGADRVDSRAPGVLVRRTASGWEPIAGGVDGAVSSLAFVADGLLVGGAFDVAGGVPAAGLVLLRPP